VCITTLAGSWVLYDWIALDAPRGLKLTAPTGTIVGPVESRPVLIERGGKLCRTVTLQVRHLGEPARATARIEGAEGVQLLLRPGSNTVDVPLPADEARKTVAVTIEAGGKPLARREVALSPVRKWVVYILPHSHVDIGYTQVQTKVERDHWRFYEQAIEASRKTAGYPPGAQFKWNVEVLWATDSYLRQASDAKRRAFVEAVRKGWIGLDALYGNELTALCSQEELIRLTGFARRLAAEHAVKIDSAMISDVPGYTWGTVGVLARSGVRYFSIGPNGGHRIGYTLSEWGDRPFWWLSPCGRHKVLAWIPRTGYWRGFRGEAQLMKLLEGMAERGYPYELVQIRHCLGDNAGPGVAMCDFVKDWNTRYAYPRLVIATTREMFRDFERRYGKDLPTFRGDFTPYWEDGAGSSARETALNRAAAERLVQAETLWALFGARGYPEADFYAAWRNAILYDEHTWGAHNSISKPDGDFAKAQWKIKQAFALDADRQSRKLLAAALARRPGAAAGKKPAAAVDVYNTTSWPRTDVVVLPKALQRAGDAVTDARGRAVPSQRLSTGELALLAADVPPLGGCRFRLAAGEPTRPRRPAAAGKLTLSNGTLSLRIDPDSGAVASLRRQGAGREFVDASAGPGVNDYLYVAGRKPDKPRRSSGARVRVGESGPLVASLVIDSNAPGCNRLVREVRLYAGLGRVDILNTLDRKQVRSPESVHFAFPFNVPKGVVRMDTPWAVVRPEADQLPGACKNYFTVQRWADVSNAAIGLTWATVDAPLVELGGITVDARAVGWIKKLPPTTALLSYVMNNYWETNYKADQPGTATFRYALRPHGAYDAAAAQRFGVERAQPLIAAAVEGDAPPAAARFRVEPAGVLVAACRPTDDGKARLIRLFNATGRAVKASLRWAGARPPSVCRSDLSGKPGAELTAPIDLAAWEFVTLVVRE